jgi:hypothetical protein
VSFYYLASPYSKYERGLEAAFAVACQAAALFVEAGIPVYSPIAHTHPIAVIGGINPLDHSIWLPFDHPMMVAAKGLIVLMADGWQDSYGMKVEIDQFKAAGKPTIFMEVGKLPKEMLNGSAAL